MLRAATGGESPTIHSVEFDPLASGPLVSGPIVSGPLVVLA